MASNSEYEQQREWLDKVDDIVYDLKDEKSTVRRLLKYNELYDLLKQRMETDMKRYWKELLIRGEVYIKKDGKL